MSKEEAKESESEPTEDQKEGAEQPARKSFGIKGGSIFFFGQSCTLKRLGVVAAGFLIVLVVSTFFFRGVWTNYLSKMGPHIGGDTLSYTLYSAWVYSGEDYGNIISDNYYFRTWGYPWALWHLSLKEHSDKYKPKSGYTSYGQLLWTRDNKSMYDGLIQIQARLYFLIPLCGYFLVLMLTSSVVASTIGGVYLATFIEPLFFARWVIPDSPSTSILIFSLFLFGLAIYASRWWLSLIVSIIAGLVFSFNAMTRLNLLPIVPVIWIALGLTALCVLVVQRKNKQLWFTLISLFVGVTIPWAVTLHKTKSDKFKYAKATMLSDGFGQMGAIHASVYYPELKDSELTPDQIKVRDYLIDLPGVTRKPPYVWPKLFHFTNGNAFTLKMTPDNFRIAVKDLNKKVIFGRPVEWTQKFIIPAWRSESVAYTMTKLYAKDQLGQKTVGKMAEGNFLVRKTIWLVIGPATLMVLFSLFIMYIKRHDWRVVTVVMILTGTHLSSMLVSALLGIPAFGRYRFVTEPAELIVYTAGFYYLVVCLWPRARGLWDELRSAQKATQSS